MNQIVKTPVNWVKPMLINLEVKSTSTDDECIANNKITPLTDGMSLVATDGTTSCGS